MPWYLVKNRRIRSVVSKSTALVQLSKPNLDENYMNKIWIKLLTTNQFTELILSKRCAEMWPRPTVQ